MSQQTNLINAKNLLEKKDLDAKTINEQFKHFYTVTSQYHCDNFYLTFAQKLRFIFWAGRTDLNKINLNEHIQTFLDISKINVKCRKLWLFMLDRLGLTVVKANKVPILVSIKNIDRTKTLQTINLCYYTADSLLQQIAEQAKTIKQARSLIKKFNLQSIEDLDLSIKNSLDETTLQAIESILHK